MDRYSINKVNDSLYLILENYAPDSSLVMPLFIGEERAALIDSGMGMFGPVLPDVVKSVTDKPVINILSHGHPDHIAGSVLFDEVYMNERDAGQIPRLVKEKRLGDTKMFSHNDPETLKEAQEKAIDCSGFHYQNMDDGDRFNLGGLTLQVIALPGHSQGSVALYSKELNVAAIGDAFSVSVPASSMPNLEQFSDMAEHIRRFLEQVPEDAVMYHGHSTVPVERQIAVDEMLAAKELGERQVEGDEDVYLPISPVPNQKRHVHGLVGISYNPAILYK